MLILFSDFIPVVEAKTPTYITIICRIPNTLPSANLVMSACEPHRKVDTVQETADDLERQICASLTPRLCWLIQIEGQYTQDSISRLSSACLGLEILRHS